MRQSELSAAVLHAMNPAPAAPTTTLQIGPMLCQRHKALNLTLTQVAGGTGMALGFLRQIERD